MVNEQLDSNVNIKENLDGIEGVKDIVFYPQERIRFRLKNVKVYVNYVLTSDGLHFDRDIDFWDNPARRFDAGSGSFEGIFPSSITASNNTFVEDFRTTDDINMDDTTATIDNE